MNARTLKAKIIACMAVLKNPVIGAAAAKWRFVRKCAEMLHTARMPEEQRSDTNVRSALRFVVT
ncbi:hypothetical protein [Roseovarius tolerans]|uniref:hypothetical protein n=1 Tax=Roseovarius tolerans TaxID=74031 RepID=UPI0011141EE4|nr:hypothetical protein [Roseovarius tolerans]